MGSLVNYLKDLRDNQGVPTEDILKNYMYITAGSCGPCRFGMYEAEYRLALHAGEWDDEAKRFQRHWELRVDHTDWTTRGRAAFRDELESAINQARDQDKQPWFFTLATQHPDLPSVIETRDRRHVAFLPLDAARAPT